MKENKPINTKPLTDLGWEAEVLPNGNTMFTKRDKGTYIKIYLYTSRYFIIDAYYDDEDMNEEYRPVIELYGEDARAFAKVILDQEE